MRHPPLLRTKLHRPQYEPDVVPRPQLLERLDGELRSPVTLVSAPAGFGKSTLLAMWLDQCALRSTWLSLDADDSDLSVFLNYVIAAVRVLHPDACTGTEELVALSTPPSVTILAHQLINDLDALGDLDKPFVLVLDDYDRIDNPAVHELMSILLRRPPRSLRLVVAARRDPPLPLARLRAGGFLTEVRMADLRLQPQEVDTFWHSNPQRSLDAASIAKLDSVLEGWPAGLRMAAVSVRLSKNPQQTIDALVNSHVHARDYLFREIFASLPLQRRQALLRIALLERFCAPLCDVLCAVPDTREQATAGEGQMEWLVATNLFLVPLDDEGKWYRFHHLFLQLLRQQAAKLLDGQAVAALHTCAAEWFAQEGMLDDALAHAFFIPSEEHALAIVERQRVAVLNQEDWPRMRRWLELFSPAFFEHAPALWIVKANVLLNQFRLVELNALLDRLEGHPTYTHEVATIRSQIYFWRGDADRARELARTALATLPPDNVHMYGNALIMLGLGLQISGAQDEGFARLMAELSTTAPQHVVVKTRVLLALTAMHWAAGNLEYASRYAHRMLDLGERNHLPAIRAWAHYYQGCVHYWRNELDAAEREFAAIVSQPLGAHTMVVIHGHFGLALTYVAQGRPDNAQDTLDAVLALVTEGGMLGALKLVEAFVARLALLRGNLSAARAWAKQCGEMQERLPLYFLESPALILAKICLASGGAELQRAAELLSYMHDFVVATHSSLRLIDVLAHEALLHKACGRPQAAQDTLGQALALAEPSGVVRPFVDLGSDMAALLHEAGKQGPSAPYARQLLAAFPHGGQGALARSTAAQGSPAALAMDPLTDRELEVLALLAQRLSNKEIADILVVAPVTVKSHMRNLFGKLQVSGRREAVERARALGLVH
jgi:LuxR family maltose regulon positive regulatory protein